MLPVSARFLAALRGPHQYRVHVDAFYAGRFAGPVPILAGRVTVDAGARYRRQLELSVDPRLVPTDPADLLSPYGAELAVRRGVVYPDGTSELVQVFYGPVVDVDDTLPAAGVSVSAVDVTLRVTDARLLTPRASSGAVTTEITDLITEADPSATVTFVDEVGAGVLVPDLVWDRDRDRALDELTRAIGAEWFPQPVGPAGEYVVRRVPTLADPPVWTIDTGQYGVLIATKRTQTRDGVYNAVVALGEHTDGTPPVRAVATDTNPASPLRYGGPFGRKPRFYSSPLLTATGQAQSAAAALLGQSLGAARQRVLTCVPNPALDAGDVITLVTTGRDGTGFPTGQVVERHLVAAITLPLTAAEPMRITTRSTRAAPETEPEPDGAGS